MLQKLFEHSVFGRGLRVSQLAAVCVAVAGLVLLPRAVISDPVTMRGNGAGQELRIDPAKTNATRPATKRPLTRPTQKPRPMSA
jgi:hypothetical protein